MLGSIGLVALVVKKTISANLLAFGYESDGFKDVYDFLHSVTYVIRLLKETISRN